MRILPEYSEPEHVKDREPYRIRIDGKDGQAIEVVEQMNGGFLVAAVSGLGACMIVMPQAANTIIIRTKP